MFTALTAIVISIILVFFTPPPLGFDVKYLMDIILVGGVAIFAAQAALYALILTPFSKLEQNLVPGALKFLRKDTPLRFGRLFFFTFILLSFFCTAIVSRVQKEEYQDWFFIIWLILFGASLDVLRDSWRRIANLLSPSFLASRIASDATTAIQNGNHANLLGDIDNLSEVGLHATERSKLALSSQVVQSFSSIMKAYFESSKSIAHAPIIEDAGAKRGDVDEESYTLFYLLQRLELINDSALRTRCETVCRQMITALGKIIIYAGTLDLSMVSFPTHFITKFGLKAQQHYFDEVTTLTTSTLLEVAKTLLAEVDITYAGLKEPFESILNGLSAVARGTFKKNKESNIKVLLQPLLDYKKLFQSEKTAKHRDLPQLMQQINNAIEEFSILQQVIASQPIIADEPKSSNYLRQ